MKKLISICAAILLLGMVFLPINAKAAEVHPPRFVDVANLVEDYEEAQITAELDEISESLQFDVVIVTVNSTGGKSMRDYADDFFDYNGYGMGDDFDGTLLLVNMEYREWYISTTGYGIKALTDSDLDYIGENVADYLAVGEYANAFTMFAHLVEDEVLKAQDSEKLSVSEILVKIPIALVIGGLISFIPVTFMKRKMNNVEMKREASDYMKRDRVAITDSRDIFLYRTVNRIRRPQNEGGGSSTHRGSSGRSHGGRGGRF